MYELELYGHFEREDDLGYSNREMVNDIFKLYCSESSIKDIIEKLNKEVGKQQPFGEYSYFSELSLNYDVEWGVDDEQLGTFYPLFTGYNIYHNGELYISKITTQYSLSDEFYELENKGYLIWDYTKDDTLNEEKRLNLYESMMEINEDEISDFSDEEIEQSMSLNDKDLIQFYIKFLNSIEFYENPDWADEDFWNSVD